MRSPETWRQLGLNDDEYEKIVQLIGREPTETELGMFSVMWSEHCGYKFSRPALRLFKNYREAQDAGGFENAGLISLTEDLGVAMKVESHNHPTAVEPFQGAATGVGGIVRDIFTMGARPVALLNSLRFGPLDDARNRYLFEQAVAGIGGYGNCIGVPTVAGEVGFHPRYSGNPLVNAMAVGIVKRETITYARADEPGSIVLYVGARTGRDGIHGATFASVALGEDSEEKRPNVQIGDPFMEKLLIEACLEAIEKGLISGMQDMGAAGLTCTTCEPSAKSNTGVEIDVAKAPVREQDMTPYEIMLSESQERMLCFVTPENAEAAKAVFAKWDLQAVEIGRVTDTGKVTVLNQGEIVADVPSKALTNECPTYRLPIEEPEYYRRAKAFTLDHIPDTNNPKEALLRLLSAPNIASKRWVYRQYDHTVQAATALLPGQGDAAVIAVEGTEKGIAVKIDGNGRYCYFDPFVGGQIAVAEALRNVACTGGEPKAITDCLNFGNPQRPEVFWQFWRCVEGIASASDVLGAPVVSGNVSFYNESELGEVFPTPTIGALGVLKKVDRRVGAGFQPGHRIAIVVAPTPTDRLEGLGASEYLSVVCGIEDGLPPPIDLHNEAKLHKFLHSGASSTLFRSSHDCSDGGFAIALAECCIMGGVGASVQLPGQGRLDGRLFGETQSRAIVSYQDEKAVERLAERLDLAFVPIGEAGGEEIVIEGVLALSLFAARDAYETALPALMGG